MFHTRDEFINSQASEKITLAQVQATQRLVAWSGSGPNYSIQPLAYVIGVKTPDYELIEVSSVDDVDPQTWHYDPKTNVLTICLDDSSDPNDAEIIASMLFFFSNATITQTKDLTNTGVHVSYDGRIKSAPGYKHKVGTEQNLVSVIGQGRLVLENTDAGLDEIYDTVFFENQEVRIYSWNRDLDFADAKIIFRGRVTNKSYSEDEVTLNVKDNLFDMLQNVPQEPYTLDDGVSARIAGRYKRWLYGRVDGLMMQSVDQIGSGYEITGLVSIEAESNVLNGTGTQFLSELSPEDRITIGTQEFQIESILNNTQALLDNEPDFTVVQSSAMLFPKRAVTTKNREFLVAGHACARLTKEVVKIIQLNRVVLSDVEGLNAGDFLTFNTGERIEIKNTAPGNIVVLRQNVVTLPTVGTDAIREPIQEVFIEGVRVGPDKFSITNAPGECKVTLATDAEFDIARPVTLVDTLTWSTGSRIVTGTGNVDLRELVESRDWIRPEDVSYSTYYEVLEVTEFEITLRTVFSDTPNTGLGLIKKPNYVGDSTIVSGNVLGRTEDGTPEGLWLTTSAQVCLDLLSEINVPAINYPSFEQGSIDNQELVSMAIPSEPGGSLVQVKTVIDRLCQSTTSAITLDDDLQLKFKVLLPEISEDAIEVGDEDVVSWKLTSVSGDNIRNSLIKYRHQDVLRETLASGSLVQSYSSDFVKNYIGTNASEELDIYLYNESSARVMSHRLTYLKSLSRADLVVETDLRFEEIEIGDQMILNFKRLYKRLGDKNSRKKVCVVVGKTVTGYGITFELTDMGNIYNRSSIITPNDAPDYSTASEDQKLKFGYITDNQGIVDNDPNTGTVYLIS